MVTRSIASRLLLIAMVPAVLAGLLLVRPPVTGSAASLCGTPGYGPGGVPVVDGVSPNTGSTLGGNQVVITGCGFTGFTGSPTTWFGSTVSGQARIDSDTQITATAPMHVAGAVDITVNTPFGTSPKQSGDLYTYVAPPRCLSVTLSYGTGSASPGFTANASNCPNPNPLYEFFARPLNADAWTPVQAYSTNNVLVWDSTLHQPSYIAVWAKDASSATTTFDAYNVTNMPVGSFPSCSLPTLTPAPASPQPPGVQISFTASASCTHPNPRFEFWMRPATSNAWTMVQMYSTNNVFQWDTSGLSGSYYIGVWVKDAGSVATLDGNASILFTVKAPACTSVTVAASPASPQVAGAQVTLTATAGGCPDQNPLYMFWIRAASSTEWGPLSPTMYDQEYSGLHYISRFYPAWTTSNTLTFDTSRYPGGLYYLGVWTKDASSPASADAYASIPFTVIGAACRAVSISATPASPQVSGGQITFTATASGCTHSNPLYQFVMRPASQANWEFVQDYSTSPTFVWFTSRLSGTFYIGVWAKDAASPGGVAAADYDAVASMPFLVTPASCASVSISASPGSPQAAGTQVTFRAVASACSNPNPMYQFRLVSSNSTENVVQDWSVHSTWTWNTAGIAPGTYQVTVWAKDAASDGAYVLTSIPFQVT